jgi:hypothetical protein
VVQFQQERMLKPEDSRPGDFGSNSQEEHEKSRSTHAFALEILGYVIDCVLVILGNEVLIWDD